jgi:hypothetical protein
MAQAARRLDNGDLSHWSEIKLNTFRRDVRLLFWFSFSFDVLSSYRLFIPGVNSVFVSSRLFVPCTTGASSREWVKPPAVGGGLYRICFRLIFLFFAICRSVIFLLVFLST